MKTTDRATPMEPLEAAFRAAAAADTARGIDIQQRTYIPMSMLTLGLERGALVFDPATQALRSAETGRPVRLFDDEAGQA